MKSKLLFKEEQFSILLVLTILLIIFLLVTSCFGLFGNNIYEPFAEEKYVQESRAQDLISLILGVPGLITAIFVVYRGKAWGLALWLGVLAYELYVYSIYVFGAVYNVCFLGYLASASLSLYSIILILTRVDLAEFQKQIKENLSGKPLAIFFSAIVIIFSVIWISSILKSIQSGVADSGHLIFVIDLMIVLPAFGIAAWRLFAKDIGAWLLAGLLLIKFDSLCISILAGQLFRSLNGIDIEKGLLFVFLPLGIISMIVSGIYFKKYDL